MSVFFLRGPIWTRSCVKTHSRSFALESQEPVKEFDFLGITLGYEMCYTNVLQVLDLSGISASGNRIVGMIRS